MSDYADPHEYVKRPIRTLSELMQSKERLCKYYDQGETEYIHGEVSRWHVCRRPGDKCPIGMSCPIVEGWGR
jgi:hypothetical protein